MDIFYLYLSFLPCLSINSCSLTMASSKGLTLYSKWTFFCINFKNPVHCHEQKSKILKMLFFSLWINRTIYADVSWLYQIEELWGKVRNKKFKDGPLFFWGGEDREGLGRKAIFWGMIFFLTSFFSHLFSAVYPVKDSFWNDYPPSSLTIFKSNWLESAVSGINRVLCSSRKYPYSPQGSWNFPRGRGVLWDQKI